AAGVPGSHGGGGERHGSGARTFGGGSGHVLLEAEHQAEVDDPEDERQEQDGDEGELDDGRSGVALCSSPVSSHAAPVGDPAAVPGGRRWLNGSNRPEQVSDSSADRTMASSGGFHTTQAD